MGGICSGVGEVEVLRGFWKPKSRRERVWMLICAMVRGGYSILLVVGLDSY
jgi:hypothetical protein